MSLAMKSPRWINWWTKDVVRRRLLVGGLIYAWFFGQGIPLWDCDFIDWSSKIGDKSILRVLLEWLSPLSTQPENWGFNERPLQVLVYKLCYGISGFDSWSYMIFKGVAFALVGVLIYQWSLRLTPATRGGRMAALAAAIVFMVMPGPMVAYLWHCDYAPVAECLFLLLTYLMWDAVEKTPESFHGLPRLGDPEHRRWLIKWTGLSLGAYLAYKSKADLKLIPVILALYVLIVRRRQVLFFAVPIGLMGLLAIPWGAGIFHKLPPFLPGSGGSPIGWMWQPASFVQLAEFLWSSQPYDSWRTLREPTLSLAALLGPFLLGGILIFFGWRLVKGERSTGRYLATPLDRAGLFALIWCGTVFAAVSVLPAIPYAFRVRYGMITMVPVSLLLAWVFGLFADAANRLPRWVVGAAVCLLAAQCAINLTRSVESRRRVGRVMVAIDQAYEYFARQLPEYRLTRLPDFLSFVYRPGAPQSILKQERLINLPELVKSYEPYKTYVLTWEPSMWEQVEVVRSFNGCQEGNLFDRIFPCPPETGVHLLRFIGSDPLYVKGETLRAKGDLGSARSLHEEFLSQHPYSLAGLFVVGLEAYQQQDWNRADQVYSKLERYLPDRAQVLYNHALALEQLQQYAPAIRRLKRILMEGTKDYGVCYHLYWCYRKAGQMTQAEEVMSLMKQWFPNPEGAVDK